MSSDVKAIWKAKSDDELASAVTNLDEYTQEAG